MKRIPAYHAGGATSLIFLMRRCLHIRWNARIAAAVWIFRACVRGRKLIVRVCNHEIVEVENNPYIAPIASCADNLDSDGVRVQYGVYPRRFVRRDIDFVAAANDAAFDFAGLWFSGGSDVYPHLRRALTVSAALPLCLQRL